MTLSSEKLTLESRSSWSRFPVIVLSYHKTVLLNPLAGRVFANTDGFVGHLAGE